MLIFPDLILPHLLVILYLVYFDDGLVLALYLNAPSDHTNFCYF